MIFVTVGTSKSGFDKLVKEIDEWNTKEKIILQIGNGIYIPKNHKWFRFKNTLIPYFKQARLVISHDGAATLFELCALNKKTVVVQNPNVISNPDLVKKLSSDEYIYWCKNIKKLQIIKKLKLKTKRYKRPRCQIQNIIVRFI